MSPASILLTKFATAKASISQRATVRKAGITRLIPSSMPPYPAHRPRCVIVLVLSTYVLFFTVEFHQLVEVGEAAVQANGVFVPVALS